MTRLNVVLVHGVGAPEPGSLLPEVERGYKGWLDREDAVASETVGNRRYLGRRPPLKAAPREVVFWDFNWSDISLAPKSWLGLLPFLIRLLAATVIVAARGWKGGPAGRTLYSAMIFRWLFSLVLFWLTVPLLLSLASAALDGGPFFAVAGILALATWAIAGSLREVDRLGCWAGRLVAVGIVVLALWPDGIAWLERRLFATDLPSWVDFILVLGGPALIFAALAEGLVRRFPGQALVSRIALLTVALALFSGVIAAVIAIALAAAAEMAGVAMLRAVPVGPFVSDAAGDGPTAADTAMETARAVRAWSMDYACSRPYHVGPVELATAIGTAVIGFSVLLAFRTWGRAVAARDKFAGDALRRRLRRLTRRVLAVFALVVAVILLDMAVAAGWLRSPLLEWIFGPPLGGGGDCAADILKTYSLSALRLVPFLLMAATPLVRIAFDVGADILLYLHDGSEVRRRLRDFLAALAKKGDEVVVWGHSQGSRIAVDVLFGSKDGAPPAAVPGKLDRLATSGSPVGALYGGFLDFDDIPRRGHAAWTWKNFWRGTDPIGGFIAARSAAWPQDQEVEKNLELQHVHYWIEPEILELLFEAHAAASTEAS